MFTLSAQDLTRAQAVPGAFAAAAGNAVRLPDGDFAARSVADRARRLLELADWHPAGAGGPGQHVSG